jgi:hypothetical protein
MVTKKDSKAKGKKIRFILSRDMTEDQMIEAIKKMCQKTGIKFIPAKKKK